MKKIILPYSRVRAELNGSPMSSGSCPLSTAQVTITNSTADSKRVILPNIVEDNGGIALGSVSIPTNETKTITIVLYKGKGYITVSVGQVAGCQGDVTADGIDGAVATGDGSFIITEGVS